MLKKAGLPHQLTHPGPHAVVHTACKADESGAISAASVTVTTSAANQTDSEGFLAAFAFAVAINEVRDDVDDAERKE